MLWDLKLMGQNLEIIGRQVCRELCYGQWEPYIWHTGRQRVVLLPVRTLHMAYRQAKSCVIASENPVYGMWAGRELCYCQWEPCIWHAGRQRVVLLPVRTLHMACGQAENYCQWEPCIWHAETCVIASENPAYGMQAGRELCYCRWEPCIWHAGRQRVVLLPVRTLYMACRQAESCVIASENPTYGIQAGRELSYCSAAFATLTIYENIIVFRTI